MTFNLPGARRRDPLETQRRRGHHHVGGPLGRGERERHIYLLAAAAIVAAVGSAYAGYRTSQAQAQQAQYQSKVAKNNAAQAAYNAQINAENQHLHNMRVMGAQRAALGASGVSSDAGSPLLVMMDSEVQGKLEEQRLRYGGQVRSAALISESAYLKHQATQVAEMGYVNAGFSLLGGTLKAAGYANSKNSGQTDAA